MSAVLGASSYLASPAATMDALRLTFDELAVASLIVKERYWRDRGEWGRMALAYHEQSFVRLAWFDGTGPEFVEASRAGGRGGTTNHRLSPSVVTVRGDRAVAETSVVVETRTKQDGIEIDLFAYCRYLHRSVRETDSWRLTAVECICEKDRMQPVRPGDEMDLDPGRLATYRSSYQFVSYNLDSHGITPRADLPGDDRPDLRQAVYADAQAWLTSSIPTRRIM